MLHGCPPIENVFSANYTCSWQENQMGEAAGILFFCGLVILFHGEESNPYGPHIGAGFRDHQHTNHRNDVAPKHHRNIKPKTKCDGQPHPAERMVIVLFGALVKQHNHKQP